MQQFRLLSSKLSSILFSTITFALVVAGCAGGGGDEATYESMEPAVTEDVSAFAGNTANATTMPQAVEDRKIIWNADLEFQVKDVNASSETIKQFAKKHGAFVSDMNLSSNEYSIRNAIRIRVESHAFDALIADLKGESIFMKNISISSQDVTEEFIDIESRLKTKKDVRDRYIAILRDKTGEIKDVIEAEEAIRKITEEIEVKEGRLRYLKDKVKFSTILVEIYQEVEFTKEPAVYIKPYSEKLVGAFGNGWSIVTGLVLGLVNLWPLVLVGGVVFWKRGWIKRKLGTKRGENK